MVLDKIKNIFSKNDEKYEVLYYKYSKLKLENKTLKEKNKEELESLKSKQDLKFAKHLISLYEDIEETKEKSFKVDATNPDIQKLLLSLNKAEKEIKKIMKEFYIEEIIPQERMYDPDLHEIATYTDAKGMKKGMILKTSKKGFKFKGKTIKKPKVIVTK